MEVRKLTISEETRKKLHSDYPLTKKRKREIKAQGVKDFINSNYSGKLLSVQDLIRAAGYRFENVEDQEYKNGWSFIDTLVKKGVIVKNNDGLNRNKSSYSVTNASLHGRPIRKKKTKNIVQKTIEELQEQTVKYMQDQIDEDKKKAEERTIYNVNEGVESILYEKGYIDKNPNIDQALVDFNDSTKKEEDNCYSFTFLLEKRSSVEHGKQTVARIELNDTTLTKLEETIAQMIKVNR